SCSVPTGRPVTSRPCCSRAKASSRRTPAPPSGTTPHPSRSIPTATAPSAHAASLDWTSTSTREPAAARRAGLVRGSRRRLLPGSMRGDGLQAAAHGPLRVALLDLQAVDPDVGRGGDAEADLAGPDRQERDLDVAVDDNRFAETPRQDQHGHTSLNAS